MSMTNDNISVNRNYKDRLFRLLFADKKRGLELYNALNLSSYSKESELEIKTLEDAIWMKMKNDVAYLIRDVLALYEHQNTLNPNLPVRGLLYFADLFRGILGGKHIYGSKLISLPTPVYIVFYNGDMDMGEEQCLKLSDAFIHGNEQSKMELEVQILNINSGHNKPLMARCPTLMQYAELVGKIKAYKKTMNFEDAVKQAVEECIEKDVLKEFLIARRAEVMNSILTEYNEEQVLADIGKEHYEDGLVDGIAGSILNLLEDYGVVSDDLRYTIQSETNLDILKKWLKLAAKAPSLEAFKQQM